MYIVYTVFDLIEGYTKYIIHVSRMTLISLKHLKLLLDAQ